MIADRIEREIRIEAPIDIVWAVVTEPDQIRQWFADGVDLDVEPGAGGTVTFTNTGRPDTTSTFNVRIERLEPPYYFAFRWVYPDGVEPDESNAPLVEFTLVEEGEEATRLKLVESGLRSLDWEESEKQRYFEGHSSGWDFFLGRLQVFVHQGAAR